jgi:hypothetical protein
MGLISPSQSADGNAVTAAAINNPINTIANEVNGSLDNANVKASAAIATSKLAADNGITAGMLSSSAITLGYAQITAAASTASASAVQVAGLTATVIIPAGSRRIKITAFCPDLGCGSIADVTMTIWDGTVGSGTQLSRAYGYVAAANQVFPATAMAVVTPAAGSKTYNVGLHTTAGTATLDASATFPAFILVEAI